MSRIRAGWSPGFGWLRFSPDVGAWLCAVAVAVVAWASAAPASALMPHGGYVPGSELCDACHDPHAAASGRLFKPAGSPPGQTSVCLGCHDGVGAISNVKDDPEDSFALASGHLLEDTEEPLPTGDLTDGCSGCHTVHEDPATRHPLWRDEIEGATVTGADNTWCTACHDDSSRWFTSKFGRAYPGAEAPERDSAGYPVFGTFPGPTVYSDPDADAHASIPATSALSREAGDCLYCHAAHKGENGYDALRDTFRPSSAATVLLDQTLGLYANACFDCHGGVTPSYLATAPADIRQHTTAGGVAAGHRIFTAGGNLPVGAPLPCYDCHGPHGSTRGNDSLLADTLGGSLETSTAAGVRHTCLSCHSSSDDRVWDATSTAYVAVTSTMTVEGLRRDGYVDGVQRNFLELHNVSGHESADPRPCYDCHGRNYVEGGSNVHNPYSHGGGGGGGTGCEVCHSATGSHTTHVSLVDPKCPELDCEDCHQAGDFPNFASGVDANLDGHIDLSETDVCDTCHSPGGAYNGVVTIGLSVGAKDNWATGVYTGSDLQAGKGRWCIGCHDDLPSVVNTEIAPNKAGDSATYGYYVTGHGRETAFPRMAHQAAEDPGNDAASKSCTECHYNGESHINEGAANSRLRAGYQNDASNSNCKQCHDPGTGAGSSPDFYTTYAAYQASAHDGKKCSDCHDVHGTAGAYTGMTEGDKEALCNQCHSGHGGHAIGASFGKGGKTYSLRCTSCHNVHVLSGMTSASETTVSAMTRFVDNTEVWGDEGGEKMESFAAGGIYQKPTGDSMDDSQLPDYATFCLDCHATAQAEFGSHGGINWNDMHGRGTAAVPNGGSLPPDWYNVGMAKGWDGDDNSDWTNNWPVLIRGRGEQLWSREAYDMSERIRGGNYVMSCSDCHVTHPSGSGKMRSTINGGDATGEWKKICNSCHYYYSQWHAGMSCGAYNDCHTANIGRNGVLNGTTIHGMPSGGHSGGERTFDPNLVADMRFENNLNDSGSSRMHGRWRGDPSWDDGSGWAGGVGSYVAGKYGQAIEMSNQPVEIGTRNKYWSTDDSQHGTWRATEMKYHTTVEAWVYPTDDSVNERKVITKYFSNDGNMNGGYLLTLKKIDGTLRAGFVINANGGGQYGVYDSDSNGMRGAYSYASVPLNRWTHIAATYDTGGPDRDPSDPSVGRIRVYVDGEDVTASNTTTTKTYCQPGSGETYMFPYSQHSYPAEGGGNPWGFLGNWCASPFVIGGYNWSSAGDNFIGRLDELKVWNITKDGSYFAPVDQATAPRISEAVGIIGSNQLRVTFSEGVYANTGGSGALQASDLTLTDSDNGRTITGVTHVTGEATATLTLSSPLDDTNDVNTDQLAPAADSVYDEFDNAAATTAVTITPSSINPPGDVVFNLNEASGSAYVLDDSGLVSGRVYGSGVLSGSEFVGDGVGNYLDFSYNNSCLNAETTMTLEARIKPAGLTGVTGNYVRRILGKATGGGNYQMSVWRIIDSTNYPNYTPGAGEASIAFWVRVVDAHGGQTWKPVLTEATNASSGEYHPIVSDHWYKVRAVWNTYKPGGTSGQPFVPANIYVDDQGTDGNGAGELWSGYVDATDADQSQLTAARQLYTEDRILMEDGIFRIGANTPATGNFFNGQIDWIKWKPTADYTLAMGAEPEGTASGSRYANGPAVPSGVAFGATGQPVDTRAAQTSPSSDVASVVVLVISLLGCGLLRSAALRPRVSSGRSPRS